jgi:hypothetical protein
VYSAIEQDLTDAAAVLPQSYTGADLGRATKGAALAMHAKVAMYLGHWNDVLNYTNQVMGLGYNLYTDFGSLFRVDKENCSESIFEIQCALISGNSGASNSQYSQVQGVRGVTGGGWGFNVPTDDLVSAFEAGDPDWMQPSFSEVKPHPGAMLFPAACPIPCTTRNLMCLSASMFPGIMKDANRM